MRVLRKWLLLLSLAFAPLPALGQSNCGGFIDVSPTDFFCNNVEWIANRLVTLGCTVTEYCPNNFVLRSQMAAFMQRLGDALAPTILRATNVHSLQTYDPPNNVYCISTPFAVTNFPRQATFAAVLMNYNASATKLVQGQLVFSTDGGVNWNPTTGDFVMWQTIDPTERTTLALVGGPLALDVGITYQFAIRTATNTPVLVDGECQLNTRIESRTGASTPF